MLKLRDLLDIEVERHDHEWMETMQRLTNTEKTEKRPVTIRSRDAVRDCRSLVNQLVNSMLKDVFLRFLYTEHREATNVQTTKEVRVKSKSSVTRKVQFLEAREEYEPCSDSSSGDETGRLVRGVEFKATKEQNFVPGVEKHHRQVGV